jgi:(1->4)-alpha-D-glucan 1-alpha-D-glucosylmutase
MLACPIPSGTYRMQFNPGFRYADAANLIPYLYELGVTDLYASPHFKARKGSSHGYDVTDPLQVNPELGTEEEFEELVQKLKTYGMGLLLDIVPNHMAVSSENPWWMDTLENGQSSAYAAFFDIDWRPAGAKAAFLQENRILLPLLDDLYGRVLEEQKLRLEFDGQGFFFRHGEMRLPLDPKSYGPILEEARQKIPNSCGAQHEPDAEFAVILRIVADLPPHNASSREAVERRRRSRDEIIQRLGCLSPANPEARKALEETLLILNGTPGVPKSFDRLDALLSEQPYRLAYWKLALEEINYRRFLDVNDLVCLRIEDPCVFNAWHPKVLQLVREGKVRGLRIDHIDGLYDPLGYLERLQTAAGALPGQQNPHLYLVAEKILGANELLPEEWPVSGTTGYDFLITVNGVFIDPVGIYALEEIYSRFVGIRRDFAEVCYTRKKQAIEQLFASEIRSLDHLLGELAAQDRWARDIPKSELEQALAEVTACLPVYRTYIRNFDPSARDRMFIERALEAAREVTPPELVSDDALAFLRRLLLLDPTCQSADHKEEWLPFVMRWQQFTAPVMVKGLEDTAFYIHNSLISLNEIGGDPLRKPLPLDTELLHFFNQERLTRWPNALNATSTHDTKRNEDVRARINVLSELPQMWAERLERWSRWNDGKKTTVNGEPAPDQNEEVLLYQTMLGAWPLHGEEIAEFKERLAAYAVKVGREAKTRTSWLTPNIEYETAVAYFLYAILDESDENCFLADLLEFQKRIAFYGAFNALAQALLKIASPGVPDFYQGTELWDFSLVDPDNRRPVDFQKRAEWLGDLQRQEAQDPCALVRDLLTNWPDGRIKLFVTWKALNFRRSHQELFAKGEYVPLYSEGQRSENVCAFARRRGSEWALAAVPRLLAKLIEPDTLPIGGDTWGQSILTLPNEAPQRWLHVLTGENLSSIAVKGERRLELKAVFHSFPLALLTQAAH